MIHFFRRDQRSLVVYHAFLIKQLFNFKKVVFLSVLPVLGFSEVQPRSLSQVFWLAQDLD